MSPQPKWQRARVVQAIRADEHFLLNREFWCRIGRPVPFAGYSAVTGRPEPETMCLETNLINEKGEPLRFTLRYVELLARDENDFAEDVPLQRWEDFRIQPTGATA